LAAVFEFTWDRRKQVNSRFAANQPEPTHAPILLFDCAMQNNAAMRWAWPFKARVGNSLDEAENRLATGDAWPDFLCVGAQKAGTSWLYHQLTLHPDFWMPPIKEPYYFETLSRVKRYNPPR
jgi:hypothetical protein